MDGEPSCFFMRLGRGKELAAGIHKEREKAVAVIIPEGGFWMPLDGPQKGMVRMIEGFQQTIFAIAHGGDGGRNILRTLVMPTGDGDFGTAHESVERTILYEGKRMAVLILRLSLPMGNSHVPLHLARDILIEGAAQGDEEDLKAPADTQGGLIALY